MRVSVFCGLVLGLIPSLLTAQALSPELGYSQPALPHRAESAAVYSWRNATEELASVPASVRVMPVWVSENGRWLSTVMALPAGLDPSLPLSPSIGSPVDWTPAGGAFLGGKLRWQATQRVQLNASLGQWHSAATPETALAFACTDGHAVFGAGVGADCGTATALMASPDLPGRIVSAQVSAGWQGESAALDLTYGLSWLPDAASNELPDLWLQPNVKFDQTLFDGSTALGSNGALMWQEATSLTARGNWRWGARGIDLTAALAQSRLLPLAVGLPNHLNRTALSFGLQRGPLSGVVTGHILSASGMNTEPLWTGVDFGLSWRMPWAAQLSVGARNLWSSGATPRLADPAVSSQDAEQDRVPYVRYEQDL